MGGSVLHGAIRENLHMNPQGVAFVLFLVLSGLAAAGFLFVVRSVHRPKDVAYETVAAWRRKLFLVLVAALAVFLVLTLPLMPYPDAGEKPDRVVHVRARQFLFEFSGAPFEGDAPAAAAPGGPVRAGELVEYRLTSADVTHGFGIYTPEGDLINQVQAMPGYINRLRLRFPAPGTYPVLCMEYCGVAHHMMRAAIEVAPAAP